MADLYTLDCPVCIYIQQSWLRSNIVDSLGMHMLDIHKLHFADYYDVKPEPKRKMIEYKEKYLRVNGKLMCNRCGKVIDKSMVSTGSPHHCDTCMNEVAVEYEK